MLSCAGVGVVSAGGSKGSRSWQAARMFRTVSKRQEPRARARAAGGDAVLPAPQPAQRARADDPDQQPELRKRG